LDSGSSAVKVSRPLRKETCLALLMELMKLMMSLPQLSAQREEVSYPLEIGQVPR
jgi:hypothetical protein